MFSESNDDEGDWGDTWFEPDADDEADREAPHPSFSDLPDPLDEPFDLSTRIPSDRLGDGADADADGKDCDGQAMTYADQRALAARLAQIKQDAYARHSDSQRNRHGDSPTDRSAQARPGKTEIYVHITAETLACTAAGGDGVLRVEEAGPLLASQLAEVVGFGPYVVKPVIDLNKTKSSDAYEATNQIREHIKLVYPAEQFPYGTRETTNSIDHDHIEPWDPEGPPGQTSTENLVPLSRYGHRVKTLAAGWSVRRIDAHTLEWTTPHGFVVRVDPAGTHRLPRHPPDP
ncbi:hypothetical protein OG474_35560 [Kribbella sp. NBC_01505]|uniref:hypothetical protein n=1 Tax=Kribbella sp. NBC_01505 TaxID=2903580 RepID=UPI003870AE93